MNASRKDKIMLRTNQFQTIAESSAPIFTLYLNTRNRNASRHPRIPTHLAWFRKEAAALARTLLPPDKSQFEKQVRRVEQFLERRRPEETALAIFAGYKAWTVVPLQTNMRNEIHWGRPALGQLFRLLNEHKPYGVVVVDHSAARFFMYHIGELTALGEKLFVIDKSQWKKKELGHVTSEQIQKSRGANRDLYEHRLEAQYEHLCGEIADEAVILSMKFDFAGIFLVGPDRLTNSIRQKLPRQFEELLTSMPEDLGKALPHKMLPRLEPRIAEFERQRQIITVEQLLAEGGRSVANPDEILARLQRGAIHTIVVASDFDVRLRECGKCGTATRFADPACPRCGGELRDAELLEILPRLAAKHHVKVEFVSGGAAQLLAKAGGIGGWPRQPSLRATG